MVINIIVYMIYNIAKGKTVDSIERDLSARHQVTSPTIYHIDDSLANVKLLHLPSRDLPFIPRDLLIHWLSADDKISFILNSIHYY